MKIHKLCINHTHLYNIHIYIIYICVYYTYTHMYIIHIQLYPQYRYFQIKMLLTLYLHQNIFKVYY